MHRWGMLLLVAALGCAADDEPAPTPTLDEVACEAMMGNEATLVDLTLHGSKRDTVPGTLYRVKLLVPQVYAISNDIPLHIQRTGTYAFYFDQTDLPLLGLSWIDGKPQPEKVGDDEDLSATCGPLHKVRHYKLAAGDYGIWFNVRPDMFPQLRVIFLEE